MTDTSLQLRHPPETQPWGLGLTPEDEALLNRIVSGISRYRMEVPAIFTLESLLPLALVGSQAMHFLSPVVTAFVSPNGYDRLARLMERRDVIERVMCRLEQALNSEKG